MQESGQLTNTHRQVHPAIEGAAVPVVLAIIVLLLGACRLAPHVSGTFHDDGIYVATAKSLAEGNGFRLIDLPGQPAQTKYPFLYPAALAVIWKSWPRFPENLVAMQWLSLVCAAAAVALANSYLTKHRFGTKRDCVIASLICATSPAFLYSPRKRYPNPFSLCCL